jgi:hypothetical protein
VTLTSVIFTVNLLNDRGFDISTMKRSYPT